MWSYPQADGRVYVSRRNRVVKPSSVEEAGTRIVRRLAVSLVSAALAWAALSLGPTAAATTFVVNAADDVDDGVCDAAHCSLREAINAANAAPGVDNITFNIPGAAPHTIQPTSELPGIADPLVIDGGTAPNCAGTPGIELDGSNAGFAFGLRIFAGPSTIRGLVINRFSASPRAGLYLSGNGGNHVECSYIGTDTSGTIARGNDVGVLIESPNNLIGGTTAVTRNVISGNDDAGVRIEDNGFGQVTNFAIGNVVSGNYIGTDVTGTAAVGNHFQGVFVNGPSGNIVGGSAAGSGNVISGNHGNGVIVGSSDNIVQGNLIGTNAAGTAGLGNDVAGVIVFGFPGRNNTIGGSSPGARNVISGNGQGGLQICCQNASANIVRGNYIGTNAAGTVALPNAFAGVLLNGGTKDNVIGGPGASDGNLVSGNAGEGVWLDGPDVTGNSVQGNRIGVQSDETSALGNTLDGILLNSASANAIGGMGSAGNIIAHNGRHGVAVAEFGGRCCSVGDTISGNSILSNGGLGIDLGFDGVTPNDLGDGDTGPNNLQNFPVLTDINSGGASTTVVGTLNSAPLTTFRVEFFTSGTCDATGYGEGESFLGAAATVTDAGGNASFSVSFPSTVAAGRSATATATDPAGNTSEFSLCRAVTSTVNGPPATLTLSPPTATNTVGQQHCVTATVTDAFGNPVSGVSVVFSVTGTNSAGPTTKTTDASGQAQFCYTGTKAGEDAIRAFADTNGNGSQDAGEPTGAATKTYVAAAPATLVLSPPTATNTVGTQHCVTATVTDAFGNPTPNQTVRFSVTGSVTTSGFKTTDANGQATFCYQGPELPGADAIKAYADSNNSNTQDVGEPAGAATKTWVLPVSTPLCPVTITDGGRITANDGDKATFGGNAKLSESGSPSGQEEYQDHGPATNINVHSIKILAVTCSADKKQASIYGQATINGSGSYLFKIDVRDLADPGVGKDTYRILLSNGYDSGEHTLEGGNIQIRIG